MNEVNTMLSDGAEVSWERLPVPGGKVTVVENGSILAETTLILAHGAGAPWDDEFMAFFARSLAGTGVRVVRFNFLYMEAGKKAPDRAPVLESTYRAVLAAVAEPGLPAPFIGGKSMGGRIGTHLAAEGADISGVVLLGYPLHPPGRPEKIRDEHLYKIEVPMLFVEGTRDPFCPLETLARVREKLPTSELLIVEDGDHSLKVRKSSGRSTQDAWSEAAAGIAEWMRKQR